MRINNYNRFYVYTCKIKNNYHIHNKKYTKYILYMDPKCVVLVTLSCYRINKTKILIIKFSLNSTNIASYMKST